jgi:hypothetical protein
MSLSRKTAFSYQPLPRPRESIRLLQLLPGSADQAIHCTLTDNFISSLPHYSALSYTWDSASGDGEEDCSIELNSKLLPIRKNLHAFLKVLRSPNKTRTLWADAVCIDQANTQERNQQVSIMGQVYSRADEVLVWLGEDADDSEELFDYVAGISDDTIFLCKEDYYGKVFSYSGLFVNSEYRQPYGRALCALFHRKYWNRLWIIQEIVLAREIKVYCGEQWVHSRQLSWFAQPIPQPSHLDSRSGKITYVRHGASYNGTWTRFDEQRRLCGRVTLESLIKTFGSAECHDVRDRVYGLLSLATDGAGLEIDYSEPTARLFFRVMAFCKTSDPIAFGRLLQDVLKVGSDELKSVLDCRTLFQRLIRESLVPSHCRIKMWYCGKIGLFVPRAEWMVELNESAACLYMSSLRFPGDSVVPEWRNYTKWDCFTTAPAKLGDHLYVLGNSRIVLIFRPNERAAPCKWMPFKSTRGANSFVGYGMMLDHFFVDCGMALSCESLKWVPKLLSTEPELIHTFRSASLRLPEKSRSTKQSVSWPDMLQLIATPGRLSWDEMMFQRRQLHGKAKVWRQVKECWKR